MNIKEANKFIVQNIINDVKGFAPREKTKNGVLFCFENDSFGKLSILIEDDIMVFINFDTLYVPEKFVSYQYIGKDDSIDDDYVELTTLWIKNLLFEAETTQYCIEHYGACGDYQSESEEDQQILKELLQNSCLNYGNCFEQLLSFKASYNNKELLQKYLLFINANTYFPHILKFFHNIFPNNLRKT